MSYLAQNFSIDLEVQASANASLAMCHYGGGRAPLAPAGGAAALFLGLGYAFYRRRQAD